MASRLEVLLRAISENPDRRISELPLLTARERQRTLVMWNETAADYPRSTIHELVERQVGRSAIGSSTAERTVSRISSGV